ncbi:MAG: phosphatase PAP2 family protein [Clostridia bacterium]|nr:phosphatase PAP2 family protein [Clostridia bacterium]
MSEIFDVFLNFDLSVFEWVQSIQSGILNTIMVVITTLGDEGIIFITLGLVLMCTKKYRKAGLAVLISLLVMTVLNNVVLKDLFARVRPFYIFDLEGLMADKDVFLAAGKGERFNYFVEKVTAGIEKYPEFAAKWTETYEFPNLIDKLTSYSFPSGHTSSAFAAAIAVLWYDRKIGIPTTIFAALMGFSRIYVQVHYCSDVIAGVIVGIIYALIGVLIVKFLFPVLDKYVFQKLAQLVKSKKKAA